MISVSFTLKILSKCRFIRSINLVQKSGGRKLHRSSHKKPVCGKCEGIFTFHIMNLVEMQHMEGPNKFCNYYMQLAGKIVLHELCYVKFSCVCLAFKSHDFH